MLLIWIHVHLGCSTLKEANGSELGWAGEWIVKRLEQMSQS